MGSNFVSQLLDLVASPVGLSGLVISIFVLIQARQSPPIAWFLFTLCCFTASLAEFRDEFVLEAPALVFPLQQLRAMGRPLTVMLLGLLIVLAYWAKSSWRQLPTPKPLKYLLMVQTVVLLKTIAYGSISFAFLAFLTFVAIVIMMRLGPCRWLQDEESFRMGTRAIAMVGLIFIAVNLYQARFDTYPITFVHGLFLGTTGNPQHAATLLAATVPCFMFLIESQQDWKWNKAFWLMGLILILVALLLTGSRTGFIMSTVSILLFYRQRGGALLRLMLVAGTLLAVILPLFSPENALLGFNLDSALDKYLSGSNSRAGVWTAMWRGFMANPLFGVPLQGDRLGYGENSWLAAGATLGLLGLVPLVLFGWACIRMMLRLNRLSHHSPGYYLHGSLVIAGLLSLLIGSIFEAFLLGTLTFPLLALIMYLALGQYLLEVESIYSRQTVCLTVSEQML